MMRHLWHDILTHRLVTTLFALCWVGVWVIIVVTWTQGAPIGMPITLWLFVAVAVASVIVGWWRMPATTHWSEALINDSMRHGLVVAVMLTWLNLATQTIVSLPFAPGINEFPPGRTTTWYDQVAGSLFIVLLLGVIASVAGMIGGLIGGTLAHVFRRWRHRDGPIAPAGVS